MGRRVGFGISPWQGERVGCERCLHVREAVMIVKMPPVRDLGTSRQRDVDWAHGVLMMDRFLYCTGESF